MKKDFSKSLTAIIAGTVGLLILASSLCVALIFTGCSVSSAETETEGRWAADPDDPDLVWPDEEQAKQMSAEISEVFHDQAGIYMVPYEPRTTDPVTIRLRADRYNVTAAEIYYTVDYGKTWKSAPMKFNGVENNKLFDVWGIILPAMSKPYYYYFKVENNVPKNSMYYGLYGMSKDAVDDVSKCFYVKPGHSTPDWSKGAFWYSLSVNSFYNGDPVNDHAGQSIDLSGSMSVPTSHYRGMYSGDLKGVQEKLDYIKSYGVDGFYMNPIWESWDTAGYGFVDTYSVAARNGSEQALIDLTGAAHENGLRVGLDPVLALLSGIGSFGNSSDYYPLQGVFQSRKSQFNGLFYFFKWPKSAFMRFASYAPDYSSEAAQKAIYSEPDSFLQRYTSAPYNVDSFRFDSSGMLWGHDTAKKDIVSAFKNTIKSINSDVLFIGENDYSFEDGWDATCTLNFTLAVRGLADGSRSVSGVRDGAIKYMNALPRSAALSAYTYINDVDYDRLRTTIDKQWKINAATLFYMTYLGSPTIRFGDETGSAQTMSYRLTAFDWDESTWNYENNYLIRAMGELRTGYRCLKDGVVKFGEVNDKDRFMTVARWDLKNAVITAINQRGSTVEREFDVRQFGITDGTVLTDYLTGAKYTVEDGKIKAQILAGGTVFVTDGKTCSYRNRFALSLSEGSTAVQPDQDIYDLSGNGGSLTGKADTGAVALTPAFGAFGFTSKINTDGEAAILVKASESADSKAYTVTVKGGKATVFVREKDGAAAKEICTADVSDGVVIGIVRGAGNVFYATADGKKIAGSEVPVEMPNKVFAGMAAASGSARFTSPALTDVADEYYADFKTGVLPAVFDLKGDGKIENGALTLSEGASYTAVADIYDHTLKATFKATLSKEGSYAGVAAKDGSGDLIFAGRAFCDGSQKIVLARVLNGELAVYASAPDTDTAGECTVQLQRVGNYYTMVYRYGGGKWNQLDSRIHCGLCNPEVGAAVFGKGETMSLSSIGFGNFAEGGSSKNTPVSVIKWEDKTNGNYANYTLGFPSWKILTEESNWNYTTGGIRQNSATGVEVMTEQHSGYAEFRAEATLDIIDGSGFAGIVFCKQSNSADRLDDGYMLKLQNGTLTLLCGDKTLAEKKFDVPDGGLRIVVERVGKLIAVFYGTQSELAFTVEDGEYPSGYFGVFTSDVSARFANYNIYNLSYTAWTPCALNYPADMSSIGTGSGSVNLAPAAKTWATTTTKGFAYTDFQAQAVISEDKGGYKGDGYVGFGIGNSEGVSPEKGGIVIALNGEKAVVLKDGKECAQAAFTGKKANTLKIVAKKGVYTVYVNENEVLKYTDPEYSGGSVAFAAYNRKGSFSKISVTDISD